ncbi:MAG: cytochrome C oxidase subunit IV family protein [Phycisphaerales bacterium]
MSAPHEAHAHGHMNAMDPHGDHAGHHGHVIIPVRVLAGVLCILLFFTVVTVFFSRAEGWVAGWFHIEIPHLVNVLVALSIAVVKSVLVAMYFMQLKYDNPLNALVFLFCLVAFTLFMFFSMTDLGTRAAVYDYKAPNRQEGGTGLASKAGADAENQLTPGRPLAEQRRLAAVKKWGEAEYARRAAAAHAEHAHDDHGPKAPSDANRSRPLRGVTAPAHGHEAAPGHAPAPAAGH